MSDFDDSKMYDPPESMTKEDYRREQERDEARARKQVAEVTRAERAYRRENNIPLSAKTHPGYYHMDPKPSLSSGGGGGGAVPVPSGGSRMDSGGAGSTIHNLNPLKMADGGLVHGVRFHGDMAGNHCGSNRSHQDYKK